MKYRLRKKGSYTNGDIRWAWEIIEGSKIIYRTQFRAEDLKKYLCPDNNIKPCPAPTNKDTQKDNEKFPQHLLGELSKEDILRTLKELGV